MNFSKRNNLYEIIFFVLFAFFMFYKPAVCSLLLGSFMIFKSIEYYLFLKYILKNGIRHIGEIVSHENYKGYKTPIIAFEIMGQNIKQIPQLHFSSDIDKFKSYKKNIGKTVSILYDPKKPEKFILANKNDSSYFGLFFTILVGIVFIIISISAF